MNEKDNTRYKIINAWDEDEFRAIQKLEKIVTEYMDAGWVCVGSIQAIPGVKLRVRNGPGQGKTVNPVNGGFHHEFVFFLMQPMIFIDKAVEVESERLWMAQVITGLEITKVEFNGEEIRCMAASVTFEPIMSDDKVTLVAPNIPGNGSQARAN